MPKTLRTVRALAEAGLLPHDSRLEAVEPRFSIAVTPAVAALIQADPDGAVGRQFLPAVEELEVGPEEIADPIGDDVHAPVKGVVHRYPDRVLLKPLHVCPVYCRFCFRRETVGANGGVLTAAEIDSALGYIAGHPEIWEVILSGGDPLLLSVPRLRSLLRRVAAIPHVAVIRIHSRVPVVSPETVNAGLVGALKVGKAVYLVLHANHPAELTPAALEACARVVDGGIPMLSQSVLLKGVNDHPDTMETLMRTFVRNRIKPYYLHHADLARGTAHFRTSIAEGQALVGWLRGRVSGLCQPLYVLDIPGGHGKVPIGGSYIAEAGGGRFVLTDPAGRSHPYP